MLFNSFDFGFFLVIVYIVYWTIGTKRRRNQNVLLLVASYLFYGLWDWRFLALLVASSLLDYYAGKAMESTVHQARRKLYLWISILWNLGILFTFKYFDFFIDNFYHLFSIEQVSGPWNTWEIIIPLGLSFYTFQTMSYSIDVFQKKLAPSNNLLEFLCFVSFFPQLVAGPIERAKKLLPQFEKKREFDLETTKEGLRQILWGLFKKILVADKLGIAVSTIFAEPEAYGSISLIYAGVLFSFQVYCDFSGYSDIAIGTAKLFGFKLSKNFKIFYLSKSLTELWRNWHITLTQWFTDYVYVPFVQHAKKVTRARRMLGLVLTMLLVGLWHGANWTFVAFGLFNGLFLVIERVPISKGKSLLRILKNAPIAVSLLYTYSLYTILCIFFRSENIGQAFLILKRIFTFTPDEHLSTIIGTKLIYLLVMIIAEISTRKWDFPLQHIQLHLPKPIRWVTYYIIIFFIIRYAEPTQSFIYFHF